MTMQEMNAYYEANKSRILANFVRDHKAELRHEYGSEFAFVTISRNGSLIAEVDYSIGGYGSRIEIVSMQADDGKALKDLANYLTELDVFSPLIDNKRPRYFVGGFAFEIALFYQVMMCVNAILDDKVKARHIKDLQEYSGM